MSAIGLPADVSNRIRLTYLSALISPDELQRVSVHYIFPCVIPMDIGHAVFSNARRSMENDIIYRDPIARIGHEISCYANLKWIV